MQNDPNVAPRYWEVVMLIFVLQIVKFLNEFFLFVLSIAWQKLWIEHRDSIEDPTRFPVLPLPDFFPWVFIYREKLATIQKLKAQITAKFRWIDIEHRVSIVLHCEYSAATVHWSRSTALWSLLCIKKGKLWFSGCEQVQVFVK